MNEKWTPGPWLFEVEEYRPSLVRNRDGSVLAQVIGDSAETEANAHLIAAAPDLYEALKDTLAGWKYIRSQYGDLYGVGWDRIEKLAAGAIAKSRGES